MDQQRAKLIAGSVPLGFGTADEAGKAVVFLASDDSSYIAGVDSAQLQDKLAASTSAMATTAF